MSESLNLTEEDLNGDPNELGKKIIQLAEIVMRKHFYASYNERDDLVSVGVCKAYSLIAKGQWKKGKGAFYNYIYAGMRNDMHNYLYHQNKEVLLEEDNDVERSTNDEYFSEDIFDLDYSLVHLICVDFNNIYGSWVEPRVIKHLTELGFNIVGCDKSKLNDTGHYCNNIASRYGDAVADDIIGRIIGLVLWKRKEYYN